ncbi:hypothetical protein EDD11_000586 [Mortierella claussenii]|nr:hypothetical protein EDD11_000586 [Mortierella claussenii]
MGEITRKRSRSHARPSDYNSDLDISSLSDSDSYSSDSNTDDDRYWRRRRHRRLDRSRGRKRRRRHYSISSDSHASAEFTVNENEDSDTPLAIRKARSSISSPTSSSKLSGAFADPVAQMMAEIDDVTLKFSSKVDKLKKEMQIKLGAIKARFQEQIQARGGDLEQPIVQSPQPDNKDGTQPTFPVPGSTTITSQGSSTSSPHANGPGADQGNMKLRSPLSPPPSLRPVSRVKAEGGADSSGMVTIRVPPSRDRALRHAFPHPRATGYQRVFEQSNYHLPIAMQPAMALLSTGQMKVSESPFAGKRVRPLVLNPYSFGTPFEGIAACGSYDGYIHFWDINAQRLLLSLPSKESRVIPYSEALAWVREDMIVAVSHLKRDTPWPPDADESTMAANVEPTYNSIPETQTNLIMIKFNPDGKLAYRVTTISTMTHSKAINCVAAVMRENHSMSYVTAGCDHTLMHWRFCPQDESGDTRAEGLGDIHTLHTRPVNALVYSHTSQTIFSGGEDGRYISYDLAHSKPIYETKLGRILHLTQNPIDPRINAVTLNSQFLQLALMDERAPQQPVLKLGFESNNKNSKIPVPSWHPDGGLLSMGTTTNGTVYLWDVRWKGIKLESKLRPGMGVVTGDVSFDNVVTNHNSHNVDNINGSSANSDSTRAATTAVTMKVKRHQHPIFRHISGTSTLKARKHPGGPSQILDISEKAVINAAFHPTKNVMIVQSADNTLGFM